MDDSIFFEQECRDEIKAMAQSARLHAATKQWFDLANNKKYSYHFKWLGLPIIQYPQDMVAMQELIWQVKPDLIIEAGVARGGSVIFYASMVKLMDIDCEVVGVDIDIRSHNRKAIEDHYLSEYITLIQGSSIDESVVSQVSEKAVDKKNVMVVLDSNHTHEHVLQELKAYAPLVSRGSYCVVFDTVIEDMPDNYFSDRPWGVGNNPKTAVHEYLKTTDRFEIDESIHNKLLITVAPDGYLKCIKG